MGLISRKGYGFLNYDKENGFTSILNGTATGRRNNENATAKQSLIKKIFGIGSNKTPIDGDKNVA